MNNDSILNTEENPFECDLSNREFNNPDCGYTTDRLVLIRTLLEYAYKLGKNEIVLNKYAEKEIDLSKILSMPYLTYESSKYFKYFAVMPSFIKDNKTYTVSSIFINNLEELEQYKNGVLYTVEAHKDEYKVRLVKNLEA